MVWQSAGRLPAASRAITSGSSSKRDCPVTSASRAGSRRRSSASASRSAVVRRPLRAGERVPTWLARMPSRRAWNAPPSESRTSLSPYQLRSMTVPSGASRSSDRCSPADVALACTTRSRPSMASGGSAKSTPSAAATSARPTSTSTSVTWTPGNRLSKTCDAAADHPGADDGHPVAEERPSVPQGIDSGLDRAGQHRTGGRHALGNDGYRAGRHHVSGLVRIQAEDRAAAQLRRSLLHGADVEVAVLDRPREIPLLERRPHRRVLAGRHTATKHQCLGAAADARPQGAHHHVVPPRLGQREPADLPKARPAQPERVRIGRHGAHLARPRRARRTTSTFSIDIAPTISPRPPHSMRSAVLRRR